MRNPKEVLTREGYREHVTHLHNLENALFYFRNNADDLHFGATAETERIAGLMYELEDLLDEHGDILEDGLPGYEDDEET